MHDRVKEILSQVRTNIRQANPRDLPNKSILLRLNRVQRQIMIRTRCTIREFHINLVKGKGEYDLSSEKVSMLKDGLTSTSWKGRLTKLTKGELNGILTTGGNYPAYYSFFNKTLAVRPYPVRADDIIYLGGYQDGVVTDADEDIPPEVPEICDDALIYGICREFDPKGEYDDWLSLFEQQIPIISSNVHNTSTASAQPNTFNDQGGNL